MGVGRPLLLGAVGEANATWVLREFQLRRNFAAALAEQVPYLGMHALTGVRMFPGGSKRVTLRRRLRSKWPYPGLRGVSGRGGGFCIIDIRFSRLASVGLIVRAPKPVICPGITDSLRLDKGVFVLTSVDRIGDWAVLKGIIQELSGVRKEAEK